MCVAFCFWQVAWAATPNIPTLQQRTVVNQQRFESVEFESLNKKLIYLYGNPKLSHRTDATKPNLRQREELAVWADAYKEFLDKAIRDFSQPQFRAQTSLVPALKHQQTRVLDVYKRLQDGALSFGAANLELLAIRGEISDRLSDLPEQAQLAPNAKLLQGQPQQAQERARADKAKELSCTQRQQQLEKLMDDRRAWSAIMDDLESQTTDPKGDQSADQIPDQTPTFSPRMQEAQRQDRLIMQAQNELKTKCRY
jgi:hypothetical protein